MAASVRQVDTALGALAVHEIGVGIPLIFWHPLFVDHRVFSAQLATLSQTYRCLAIDGPAHGATGAGARASTFQECAGAALAVMDALGVERAHFIGCAWGGHVGVHLASSSPSRLRSLVVANAPMQPLSLAEFWRIATLTFAYRLLGPHRLVAKAIEEGFLTEKHRPEHGAYVRETFMGADRKAMHHAARRFLVERPSLEDRLGRIAVPAVFIAGENDAFWPSALARQHVERVPRGRLVVIPGIAHLAPMVAPEAFNRLLHDWLREVDVASPRAAPSVASAAS